MDCILFRHGIAVDREDWDGEEAQRPLTREGEEKTHQAASGLLRLNLAPTDVLSSPLSRALGTAKILVAVLGVRSEVRRCEELLPHAPPEKLLALLAALPQESCVICVGHEPHLGYTAGLMLAGQPVEGFSLKKAGAACIRFDTAPKPGAGALRWWLTPAQLRLLKKRSADRR
jgi:phosphohistidine phosphatase